MKIYFAGSVVGGRDDADLYTRIVQKLEEYGTVLTKVITQKNVLELEDTLTPKFIHDQDMAWLEESDVFIGEVTQPSLGVGYEIGRAVTMKKKMLLLFRPDTGKRLSAMIAGSTDGTMVTLKNYKEPDIQDILKTFFESL